jgi:hypothetical protein
LFVDEESSVVLTENYAMIVPGLAGEGEGSTDIVLSTNLKGRPAAFDPGSDFFYILSSENSVYVIDVGGEDGWRAGPASGNINTDARLFVFQGILLVIQSGNTPVISWVELSPSQGRWRERACAVDPPLEGPVAIEAQDGRLILRGHTASVEVTVGRQDDAASLTLTPLGSR